MKFRLLKIQIFPANDVSAVISSNRRLDFRFSRLPGGNYLLGVEMELNSAIVDLEEEVSLDVTNVGERNSR